LTNIMCLFISHGTTHTLWTIQHEKKDVLVNTRKIWHEIFSYLSRIDIKPLNPKIHWNIEPTIIAPWSSLIMCLNFCNWNMHDLIWELRLYSNEQNKNQILTWFVTGYLNVVTYIMIFMLKKSLECLMNKDFLFLNVVGTYVFCKIPIFLSIYND